MTSRDTSADARAALTGAKPDAERTLTGWQARQVREALEAASEVLERASTSKQFRLARDARAARTRVLYAWGLLKGAKS
jgi:hypothetical protein